MRAAGYIRVSTEEQAKHGWNLDADRKRIEAIVAENDWELIAIYDDGGRQGDDPDRPGFNAMLDALDRTDVIIMRSLDRLSRDTYLYALATRAIRLAGVKVECFNGPVDLDTPEGELSSNVLAAIARFEKRQIGVRVRQMKEARAQAGGHPGGKRPYGYRHRDTTHEGKPTGPLVMDPVEAEVVRRIYAMAVATSQRKIAAILNEEGIPASKGGLWTQSQVARTLGSPLYLGKIRRKVNGTYELYDGQHEAIVNEDIWHRVNASRATPQRRVGGRPMHSTHLLTRGIGRCGSCGSALVPVAPNGRPDVYKCLGRQNHGPEFCDQPSVRRELIDTALVDELTRRYLDVDGARERIREHRSNELPLARAAVAEAEREGAKAEANLARVKADYVAGEITAAEWRELRIDLEESLAAARAAVTQAQGQVEAVIAAGAVTDTEEELLRHLADLKALVSGTVGQARDIEALRTVIRQLFSFIELCPPDAPFGVHGADESALNALVPVDAPVPMVGSYRLLIHMRPEMVNWNLEPIKAAVPGLPTPPTYPFGHFSDALFAPIEVLV